MNRHIWLTNLADSKVKTRKRRRKATAAEVAEYRSTAIIAAMFAGALLMGTGAYIWWRISTGQHPHVCIGFIMAILAIHLLAAYSMWAWWREQRMRR